MRTSDQVVHDLWRILEQGRELTLAPERFPQRVNTRAEAELDSLLVDALEWPRGISGDFDYLRRFIRWIPQESETADRKLTAPQQRSAKEVSDRLAHFFRLIDQKVDKSMAAVPKNSEQFRKGVDADAAPPKHPRHVGSPNVPRELPS